MNILRRKSVTDLQAEAETDHSLKRVLGPWHLVLLGIGCTIGTGIFVLTGTVAAQNAGPAVILSFVLAGIASIFSAFCYSEFASLVPMSGSAYTYSYATLGELFAWIIGWDLILEYAVGAITVAIGWSGYVTSLLHDFGIIIPPRLTAAYGTAITLADGTPATALFNLPAILIVAAVSILLVLGIKESAGYNNLIVIVKLAVIVAFLAMAVHAIDPANWHPFVPANTGQFGHFGWSGIMSGAGTVFFAYIGFDAVSTAAQETRNPKRDMPLGIIGSLIVCTILYILVAAVATGVVPYAQLDTPAPIALAADHAFAANHTLGSIMAKLIKFGAVAGLSSVITVLMLGQTRIFWNMSRDGLLPKFVGAIHPKFKTPWITTMITGAVVAFFSAFLTVREAGNLCSIGTLLAFVIVCISVLVLRVREPHHQRAFKTPAIWFVAPVGALSALALMIPLPNAAWKRLIVWFVIGMIIYFAFSRHNSRLAKQGK